MIRMAKLALCALIATGCRVTEPDPSGSHDGLEAVKVGIAIPSYVHGLAWIADSAGFFRTNGLEVEVVQLKGSASCMRGLLSGDLDMALAGGDAAVKANVAGGHLVILGGIVNRPYHRLIGTEEITGPEDLRGRSIGLPFLGGPQDMVVRYALDRFGLVYNQDVTIKIMGAEFARLAALERGEVDVVTSAAPPSKVAELGFRIVADTPSWDVPFPYMQMVVREGALQDRRETMRSLVKALSEAMVYYRDHPAESLAILAPYLGEDRGLAQDAYATQGPGLFSYPPTPDIAGLQRVIDFLAESDDGFRGLKAADHVDTSILEELTAAGFDAESVQSLPGPAAED